ncbi:hypothetical protein ACCO45_009517 [Purpureocillium lilacinum]|uniref:Uncharacterized protein n=1 Tax=Purpureocillium lilacinum TaxID=33203 RepID=A0ACC4DJW9_PURLI
MPTQPEVWPQRDSWPPTLVRLGSSSSSSKSKKRTASGSRPRDDDEPRPLLADIDDNPLTYFLTPPPSGAADMDVDMPDDDGDLDFDAGIEDAAHPREPVRSVSPSSLSGLSNSNNYSFSKPRRTGSPDLMVDSDGLTTDEDDEDAEDYIHFFSPSGPSRLAALRNIGIDGLRLRSQSPPVFSSHGGAGSGFSPSSSPPRRAAASSGHRSAAARVQGEASCPRRGRTRRPRSRPLGPSPCPRRRRRRRCGAGRTYRGRGSGASSSAARLPGRGPGTPLEEPSPDVWSIEEETEEEMARSEGGGGGVMLNGEVEKTAAKPKKRVRFVLPDAD